MSDPLPTQGRTSLDSSESHVLDAPPIPPPKVDTTSSQAPQSVDSTALSTTDSQQLSNGLDASLGASDSSNLAVDVEDDAESWTASLSAAQQVYTAHSDSASEEHEALGAMIALVQKLGALLQQSARDKADMETQFTLAKSNLQLALANTEMLEDALRDRGATTRDVGWRRSRPPGDLEPPFTPNNVPAPTPATPRSATVPQPQTAPPKDTRFLARFRFGATPPTTQTTPPQTSPVSPARQTSDPRSHLTSASVPNLALAAGERQLPALSINPPSNPTSQDNTPYMGVAGPHSAATPGAPPSAVYPSAPPPSAASPVPVQPSGPHPGPPGGGMQTYSGPGGTFYVAGGGVNSWQFQAQRAARFELELQKERTAKAALEAELESLSQALFEEANNMVAQERRARAAADEELNSTRAQRDALHAALQVVERENGVLRGGHWTPAADGARSRADSGASVSSVVGVRAGIDGEAFKLAQSTSAQGPTNDAASATTLKHRPSPLHDLHASSSSPVTLAEGDTSSPVQPGVSTPDTADGQLETDSDIEFAPAPRGLPDRSTDLGNIRASGRKRLASHAEEGEEEEEEEPAAPATYTDAQTELQSPGLTSPGVDSDDLYTPRVDGAFPRGVAGVVARKESAPTPEVPGGFPKN